VVEIACRLPEREGIPLKERHIRRWTSKKHGKGDNEGVVKLALKHVGTKVLLTFSSGKGKEHKEGGKKDEGRTDEEYRKPGVREI